MTRDATVLDGADGVHVVVDGRRLVSFAGCDSLGLAREPAVVAAARESLARDGLGAAASRTTTGTWRPHLDLERALARWLRAPDAVLLASGYMAGSALAVALAPRCDAAVLDAGAHPALEQAAVLSGLPVRRFRHFDAADARRVARGARPLVLVDAVGTRRGTLAPLRALRDLAVRTRGHLVVDDAHGVGVLGPNGRGAAALLRAEGPRVHLAGSLSKALGGHGGFAASTRAVANAVRARFAGYAGATPIPPSTAAAACEAVRRAAAGDDLRARLRANSRLLARRFAALGLPAPRGGVPWFGVEDGDPARLARIGAALARAGFLAPVLRYFGPHRGAFLRVAVTAAHSRDDVEAFAEALGRAIQTRRGPRVRR